MHTRLQQRDGALVKIYTFDEAFDRHVSFAVETYLDYAPPRRSRRPGHRQHSANLDPRYTPPSQVTTERIIMVIDELMTEELVQLIVQQRTEVRRIGRRRRRSVVVGRRSRGVAVHDLGSFKACAHRDRSVGRRSSSVVVVVAGRRWRRASVAYASDVAPSNPACCSCVLQVGGTIIGEQGDAMTKHGVSYIVLNGTMILKRANELKLVKFLLDYGEFPLGAHSAKNTETWWAGIHARLGIRPLIDVGDPTIDGASNGKAGARLVFKLPTAALTPGRRQNQPRT
jgi:hypothetical protein